MDSGQLRQLLCTFYESLSGNAQIRGNAEATLGEDKQRPDYAISLAFLVRDRNRSLDVPYPPEHYVDARFAAAIALRNFIKDYYKIIPDVHKLEIRSYISDALSDPTPRIRNYAGYIMSELIRQGTMSSWPDLIQNLLILAVNENAEYPPEVSISAIKAIFDISYDNRSALMSPIPETTTIPFNHIFTTLLPKLHLLDPPHRVYCLKIFNFFLPDFPPIIRDCFDTFSQVLLSLMGDKDSAVLRQLCAAWVRLVETRPSFIAENFDTLVRFTTEQHRKSQSDIDLALEAAEFWVVTSERIPRDETLWDKLGPYLHDLVPLLLSTMVYSGDELLDREAEDDDDADEEDRDQDIKPWFAGAQQARNTVSDTTTGREEGEEVDPDEEADKDFQYHNVDDPESAWTLRKCSAAALDNLAGVYKAGILEHTLPTLGLYLNYSEWQYREAAVLAIGAIAEGCKDTEEITQDLPNLTDKLLELLSHKTPALRQISCWTLGRYSRWYGTEDGSAWFERVLSGLLTLMLDRNKRVQESAASALAELEEKVCGTGHESSETGRDLIVASSLMILQRLGQCFAAYKLRNIFVLYSCAQTLAEQIGSVLQYPEHFNAMITPLVARWNSASNSSREMCPLLECLACVCCAVGEGFEPCARFMFERCTTIVQSNLEEAIDARNNPEADPPQPDFLTTSLDFMSAMVQAVPGTVSAGIAMKHLPGTQQQPDMFDLLRHCLDYEDAAVRQSAFALLGDCAVAFLGNANLGLADLMHRHLTETYIESIGKQADPQTVQQLYDAEDLEFAVVNNACWSLGEICMRCPTGLELFIPPLLVNLYKILCLQNNPLALYENAVVALGRLGIHYAQQMAPHLQQFAYAFVKHIDVVSWTDEKAHALMGFIKIILAADETHRLNNLDFGELAMQLAGAPSPFLNYTDPRIPSITGQRPMLFQKLRSAYVTSQQG